MTSHATHGRRPPTVAGADIETPAAIAVTDASGLVTHWSAGAQDLWGYAPEEIVGRHLADLFTEDWAAPRRRDGTSPDVRVNLYPLPSDDRPAGFLLAANGPLVRAEEPDSTAMIGWAFDQHHTALAVYDSEARLLRMNQEMARIGGYREDDIRGRSVTEVVPGPVYADVEERILRVLRTGKPEGTEYFVRTPGESRAHAWALDVHPLKDSAGRIHGAALSAYDYSAQYDSRERLSLLGEARTRIGTSLDVAGTARELAEVVVPRFADVVIVDLLPAVFRGDLPEPVSSGPVVLRRAAYRSASADDRDRSANEERLHPASSSITRCLATGRPELLSGTTVDPDLWTPDESVRPEAGGHGVHSLIMVPVRARGAVLGTVLFVRGTEARKPFTTDDLEVTEDLVARAAICLDNARRFTRERGIALELQRRLLPPGPTEHPAVETATRYLPAGGDTEVGGDWFDVIPLPGARVGLVVGDVVGHGVHAAASMGRLRSAVRTLADIDLPPDELLTRLDDIVTQSANGADTEAGGADAVPGELGASCLYAVYDPVSRSCALARAGHPSPVLVNPDGSTRILDVPVGPPLGLGSLPFEMAELTVPEGSVLALYTDGLVETRGQDLDERLDTLRHVLGEPAPSLEALCDAVLAALDTETRRDDVALLIARTRVLGEDQVASWELPADPSVVAAARRQVGDRLAAWGLDEMAFTTELVVSELVTNAIRYSMGPIRLQLIRDRTLISEVSDGSSTSPHLRRARLSDEGGRGLFLVAELTQRWGTRYTSDGKTIWAEQSIPGL
ncbi:SpoIIE family protein phosphatase [Streptomyces sp. NPDC090493]|uniref:SpoIIE family protein phosphatase n=1 Tax=Streptomyces sp. NPDC090493 TaxID=3365964 RepID=UPI00381D4819